MYLNLFSPWWIFLRIFFKFHFYFLVPPQISPFDFGENPANSGDVIMANCLVLKGDLPIEIFWTLNEKPIEEIHGVSVTNMKRSSQISIESVYSEHAGEYTCSANNTAGFSSYSAVLNVNGIFFFNLEFFFIYMRNFFFHLT